MEGVEMEVIPTYAVTQLRNRATGWRGSIGLVG